MLSSTLTRLLFGVAFFSSVLAADAPPGVYPDSAKSTKTTVTVHVVWLPTFEAVHSICTIQLAEQGVVGCFNPATNTIYAVEPVNFNDHFKLEILGHEFWHALGAQHPAL